MTTQEKEQEEKKVLALLMAGENPLSGERSNIEFMLLLFRKILDRWKERWSRIDRNKLVFYGTLPGTQSGHYRRVGMENRVELFESSLETLEGMNYKTADYQDVTLLLRRLRNLAPLIHNMTTGFSRTDSSFLDPRMKFNRAEGIAALSHDGLLAVGGELPWSNSHELRLFRSLTFGCPVIMGRKTAESLGKPLPGRLCLVLSRSGTLCEKMWPLQFENLEEAYLLCLHFFSETYVIGGAEIYKQALQVLDSFRISMMDVDLDAHRSHSKLPFEEKTFWPGERLQSCNHYDFYHSKVRHPVFYPFRLDSEWELQDEWNGEGFVHARFVKRTYS